ncbi:uncharacterized protein [Primulina eburnea]|uniref:uncharacterized protein n=1 Tax=Primulina eburnea TaxID=1245227 RepID=UPI003C6C8D39
MRESQQTFILWRIAPSGNKVEEKLNSLAPTAYGKSVFAPIHPYGVMLNLDVNIEEGGAAQLGFSIGTTRFWCVFERPLCCRNRIPILLYPIELQDEVSIESVKFFAMQGCAFKGHDESVDPKNRGNYIELINFLGRMNPEIGSILEKAAKDTKYTSAEIQRDILKIIVGIVGVKIREEIGETKFCILVGDAIDESNKEQMAIILRYVDRDGLQLTLVAVSKEVHDVWRFFSTLTSAINFVGSSAERHFQLKSIRKDEINDLIESGEIDTVSILLQDLVDKGLNSNIRGEAKGLYLDIKYLTLINLQQIRDGRWEEFLWSVIKFCESNDIEVPDFDDCYTRVIDFQTMELNERFLESTMELLTLSNVWTPIDGFRSFSLRDICSLVDKFYYLDFSQEKRENFMRELDHYKFDVPRHAQFQNLDSFHHLCQIWTRTTKSVIYPLMDRLV